MIYSMYTKTEHTAWKKFKQTSSKSTAAYLANVYKDEKERSLERGHLVIEFKVKVIR